MQPKIHNNGLSPHFRVGQIRKDSRLNPEEVFVITHIYELVYKTGARFIRVVGYPISRQTHPKEYLPARPLGMGTPGITEDQLRDLDSHSMLSMYPFVMFDPVHPDSQQIM